MPAKKSLAPDKAELIDTSLLGVPKPPGGGASTLPATAPAPYDLRADPATEYVAGGYFAPLGDYVRTLPKWIDPITRDFGLDTYERMVSDDPQVASCVEVYKSAVLADGWRISPAQDTDEPAPGRFGGRARRRPSPQAQEVADFCRACLTDLLTTTPFDLLLWQMLDATFQGHKVAEKVFRVQERGKYAGRLVLDRVKPKPHRSTAFVMDAYDNLIGVLGLMPNVPFYGMWPAYGFLAGDGLTLLPGEGRDALQKDAPSLLPRSKFCVLTWDGQDNSPQGRSMLRRAYTPWWWKAQLYAMWGAFVSKHGDPTVIGTVGEKAMPMPDPTGRTDGNGNPVMISPVQFLSMALAGLQNGSYAALPFGTEVQALAVANEGQALSNFADFCDRQISKAILGQTLATEEGKYGTRAQAQVHGSTKDDVTRVGQVRLTNMVLTDLLRPLVLLNYGPDSEALIPEFGLGQDETLSFSETASGIAQIVSCGFAHPSQYQGLDEMAGLPPRDEAQWNEELANRQAQQQASTVQQQASADAARQAAAAGPDSGEKEAKFADDVHWITLPGGRHIPLTDESGGSGGESGNANAGKASGGKASGGKSPVAGHVTEEKTPSPSAKSLLAKQSAKYVGADIQRYSEEHNEPILASGVKGLSLRDNEPIDVMVVRSGRVAHGIELKTMVDNKAAKITMKASAMQRKADWVKEHGAPYHTVVFDDHGAYNAHGVGRHDDAKRQIYYRRGFGSFRVSGMHPVRDMAELNRLLDTPDADLPAAAKPPASYSPPNKK